MDVEEILEYHLDEQEKATSLGLGERVDHSHQEVVGIPGLSAVVEKAAEVMVAVDI